MTLKTIKCVTAPFFVVLSNQMDLFVVRIMVRKAGNGMGRRGENIRKRIDGRWEGRYKCIYGEKKELRYRSVYAKTYREVREKLVLCKNAPQEGEVEDDHKKILFGDAAEQWLSEARKTRKYSTYIKYQSVYKKYLAAGLGKCSLDQVTDDTLKDLVFSDKSVSIQKSIYCVTNQVLSFAHRKYGIRTEKLTAEVAKPKGKPVKVIDHTDRSKLIQYLQKDMDISRLGILLCLYSGIRLGEVCALKWEDIDLPQKIIHIRLTVQRIKAEDGETKTKLLETAPKSAFSEREIPISTPIAELMGQFKREKGYFLCGNKPMEPRTYQNRFKAYLREAGIGEYNFHALRHTFATNCVESGMDTKSLSEVMGHSDVQTTLRKYVHPSLETKRGYIEKLGRDCGQKCGQAS